MNSIPSADPVANPVFAVAPHNSYPVIPGVVSQVPLYLNNQPQVHLIPGNPPGFVPAVNELSTQKVLKGGKVFGAIQILIGLFHISLGSIMSTVLPGSYIPISFSGGFPFWGGIWLNGSVGLNIFSIICSSVGIILFITDLCLVGTYTDHGYYPPYNYHWGLNTDMAISGVLLVFCLLEFCIACISSHFGCKVACCQHNNGGVVTSNIYVANPVVFPEPWNSVPRDCSVAQGSR